MCCAKNFEKYHWWIVVYILLVLIRGKLKNVEKAECNERFHSTIGTNCFQLLSSVEFYANL